MASYFLLLSKKNAFRFKRDLKALLKRKPQIRRTGALISMTVNTISSHQSPAFMKIIKILNDWKRVGR